jgi:hypothetical protein
MKNNDHAAHGTARPSFAQEMQQAITDWVRKLPFLKRYIPENPALEHPRNVSTREASPPRSTEDAPPGTPPDGEERPG